MIPTAISEKEYLRRKTARVVMIQAWRYKKRNPSYFDISLALTMGWAIVRSKAYIRHTKVRGVTFEGRQRVLATLSRIPDERISLRVQRDSKNAFDKNAVKIYAIVDGSYQACVGYLQKEMASHVAVQIESDKRCIALYGGVTGGGNRYYGLNLSFVLIG